VGLQLVVGELLHRSHFGALVEMLGRVGNWSRVICRW
jgi:hypothetical protein